MSKKRGFEDTFLNMKNDIDETINVVEQKQESKIIDPIVMNANTIITSEQSLNDYIKQKVSEVEDKIKSETGNRFKAKKKIAYSDKYIGVTISIRPELKSIIEDLKENTSLNKYEILEILLISGLKSINFDK